MRDSPLRGGAARVDMAALRRIALFRDLAEDDLAALVRHTHGRTYERGDMLTVGVDAGDAVFVVARGELRVSCLSPDGREITLNTPRSGDLFTVHENDQARALRDGTLVYRMPYQPLIHHLSGQPRAARALIDLCFRRLAEDRQRTIDLALGTIPSRLARVLARNASADAERMVLLTHQELADMIGTRPDEVTKTLRTFRERGLVAYQRRQHGIYVCDLEALAAL